MRRFEATVIDSDEVVSLSATADVPAFGAAQRLADERGAAVILESVTATGRRQTGPGGYQTGRYVFRPRGGVRSPQQTHCGTCGLWLGAGVSD